MTHNLLTLILAAAERDAQAGDPDHRLPHLLTFATPQSPAAEIAATYRARFLAVRAPLVEAQLAARRRAYEDGCREVLERSSWGAA